MSLIITEESCPVGTRFLYRTSGGSKVFEDIVVEWSPSGTFVKLKHEGWRSSSDMSKFVVLEILVKPRAETEDMCPNCVTPWKCNGPHRPTKNFPLEPFDPPFEFHREETG